MPQDFSGQNLRGRNFKGEDLTGANFSYADIRGTNFTNAILRGANFTGAKAGLQKRWRIVSSIAALCLVLFASFFVAFTGLTLAKNLGTNYISTLSVFPGMAALGITASYIAIRLNQKFITVPDAVIRTLILCGTAFGALIGFVGAIVAVAGSGITTIAIAGLLVGALTSASSFTIQITACVTRIGVGFLPSLAIPVVFITGALSGARFTTSSFNGAVITVGLLAGATAMEAIWASNQAINGDKKVALTRAASVALAAIGGTTFHNADLTDANFSQANLKSTSFRKAILTHTRWFDSQKLEYAVLKDSILENSDIRKLLVSGYGYSMNYEALSLRGANLTEVNLNRANLRRVDLSGAVLCRANLEQSNLTETRAIDTDFTGAYLTGACLEAWNIDRTTKLDQVDCQYVFLLEHPNELGDRERRPHDPTSVFAPGDFTKLYTKIINTVEILLRNGINREAFAEAFHKLMQENPEISFDSIQSIEKKGDDVLLTLAVPGTADKAKISQDFLKPYEERVQQLEAKVDELQSLRSTDLKDIALALANQSFNITNQAVGEGKAVQENNDSSRKLNIGSIGGDFNASGQALNFGEMDISGQVTNTINQLPASPQPDEPGIKELLEQLQRAIESADELKPEDKAEALKQVQALAEAGKDPAEAEKQNTAKSAIRWFKGMLTELAEPSAIAQLCKKILPHIATIFGL